MEPGSGSCPDDRAGTISLNASGGSNLGFVDGGTVDGQPSTNLITVGLYVTIP
jgi:hypothetical protein